jgi:outer membrane protein OmpA-like peptidoglycan-associated protein
MNTRAAALLLAASLMMAAAPVFAQTNDATRAERSMPLVSSPVNLFGDAQADFNAHIQELFFLRNVYKEIVSQDPLNADIDYLKAHPDVHFYIDGYASTRGYVIPNLVLAQRRAEQVKKMLVDAGIAENRIALATGWGQLYPVCPGTDDACWARNKRVRLEYAPQ